MKKCKKVSKKVLSLLLAVLMLTGTMELGIGGLMSFKAKASISASGSTASTDKAFRFVVPEAIYLYPDGMSWKNSSSTPFQYYVNNNYDGSITQNTTSSEGYIYYYYANASGAATISWSFVDKNFSAKSGGSVTLSSTSISSSNSANSKVTITEGSSPSLASTETGCYIKWTITYKDSADGLSKAATAFTYVYKPYVVPLVGEVLAKSRGAKTVANSLAWISGINSITSVDYTNTETDSNAKITNQGNAYFYYSGSEGFSAFISKDAIGYNGSTKLTSTTQHGNFGTITYKDSTASEWYALFTGTDTSKPYFKTGLVNENGENKYYTTSSSNTNTFGIKNGQWIAVENNSYADYIEGMLACSTYGNIYIDSSRYTNLKNVPNLGAGLIVTSDRNSASNSATWYVSQYNSTSGRSDKRGVDAARYKSDSAWNAIFTDHGTIYASQLNGSSDEGNAIEVEGIRYMGWIPEGITSDATKTYRTKFLYSNKNGGYGATNSIILDLHATQNDKSTLRTAIYNAQKKFPNASYYTNDSYNAFIAAYNAAYTCLVQVDGIGNGTYASISSAATALNTARNNLVVGTGTATATHKSSTGKTLATETKTYNYGDTVTAAANSYPGYNYTSASPSVLTYYNVTDATKNWTFTYTPKEYNVEVNYKGGVIGTAEKEYITVTYDSPMPQLNGTPVRPGYTFDGYYQDLNNLDETRYYNADLTSARDWNRTDIYLLQARWINPISYSVKFNGNGSTSGSMSNQSFNYDVEKALDQNQYKREFTVSFEGHGASNLTSLTDLTATATFNGWEDHGSITHANGVTYTYDDFDAPFYAHRGTGDVYNVFKYDKYALINHYVRFGISEGRPGKPTADEPNVGVYPDKASVKNLTTTQGDVVNLYANWTDGSVTLPTPTRTGYTFNGWYTEETGGKKIGDGDDLYTPTATITLHAQWTANTYTLTLDGNGGTVRGESSLAISDPPLKYDSQNYSSLAGYKAERTGYEFAGYYTEAEGGTKVYNGDGTAVIGGSPSYWSTNGSQNYYTYDGPLTLYAHWTTSNYTIEYDADGGTISGTAGTDYTTGYNITDSVKLPTNVTKTGYTFAGWKPAKNVNNWQTSTSYKGTLEAGKYGDVELKAQWEPKTYSLTLYGNGGTVQGVSSLVINDPPLKYNSQNYSSLGSYKASRTGYEFAGYYTQENGGIQVYDKYCNAVKGTSYWNTSEQYIYDDNLTLYAHWTPIKYNIVFNGNAGTGSTDGISNVEYDTTVTLTANGFTRSGYDFNGWNTMANGSGTGYADNASVSNLATSNGATVTLYAQWEAKTYTVTLNDNGGSSGDGTKTVTYGQQMPKLTNLPTRTGYTFGGYYLTDTADNYYYNDSGTGLKTWLIASDQTLYAKWTANEYLITYNSDGGSYSGTATTTYIVTDTVTLPTPTKTGYTFKGWKAIEAEGNWTLNNTYNAGNNGTGKYGNVTLKAQWEVETYTIGYTLNGGTVATANPTSYTVVSNAITLNNPTKTGYTFAGWTGTGLNGTQKTVTINTGSTGDRSYTATWTPNTDTKYTVEHYVMGTDGKYSSATKTEDKKGTTGATLTLADLKDTTLEVANGIVYHHGLVGSTEVTTANIAADGSLVIKLYYVRKQYTLTLTAGTGISAVTGAGTFYYGQEVSVSATLKTGYENVSWDKAVTDGKFTMPAAETTLTASATAIKYTITYKLDGGSAANPTEYYVTSNNITLIDPTKTGYTFEGWTGTGLSAATKSVTIPTGSTGDREYTATWRVNSYTITYNGVDGATFTTANPKSYTVENAVTLVNPNKANYEFLGWTEGDGDTLSKSVSIAKGTTGSKTFTANWMKSNLTLDALDTGNILEGSALTVSSVTAKSGTEGGDAAKVNVAVNNGKLSFTPTDMTWSNPAKYNVTLSNNASKTLTVYPQTTILYEETSGTFKYEDQNGQEVENVSDSLAWATVDDNSPAIYNGEKSESSVYGYSDSYADLYKYSDNHARRTTVTDGHTVIPTYEFSFVGTGVDIISTCDQNSGLMVITIHDKDGNAVLGRWSDRTAINTHCSTPIYQEVVYHEEGLEYGEYHVKVQAIYSAAFDLTEENFDQAGYNTVVPENGSIVDLSDILGEEYSECKYYCIDNSSYRSGNDDIIDFEPIVVKGDSDSTPGDYNVTIDGVRVYNPGNTNNTELVAQYERDNELAPTYREIRNLYEEPGWGTLQFLYVEGVGKNASWADYNTISERSNAFDGSNTEMELTPSTQGDSYALTFKVSNYERVHISLRAAKGIPCKAVVNGEEFIISSTTEQYFDITNCIEDNGQVAISCRALDGYADPILAVCGVKTVAGTLPTSSSDESIVIFDNSEEALLNAKQMLLNLDEPDVEDMDFTVNFGDSVTTSATVSEDKFTVKKVGRVWTATAELSNEELNELLADSKNIRTTGLNEGNGITVTALYEDGEWVPQIATASVIDKTPEADDIMVFFVDFGNDELSEVRVNKNNVKVEKIDGTWTATATISRDTLEELLEEAGIADDYKVEGNKVTLTAKMYGDEWHSDLSSASLKKLTWIEKLINAISNFFKLFAERLFRS